MSTDTPPNAAPPPPPVVGSNTGPSPQKIGQTFIRQYYKTLLDNPCQLNRFYQPDSTVTRGMEPAAPATPSPFNLASTSTNGDDGGTVGERVRKAFFEWAGEGVVIDFERGAIDAQESIGGGILLVVTGHAFLPRVDGMLASKPSPFVHTFFLNNAAGLTGRKKMFLIKNDILRFLDAPAAPEVVEEVVDDPEEPLFAEDIAGNSAAAVVEEPVAAVEEQPVAVILEPTPAAVALVKEAVLVRPPPVLSESAPLVPVEYEASASEEKVEEDEIHEPLMVVQHEIVDVDPPAEEEKIDVETSSAESDSSPDASPAPDANKKKKNRKKKGSKSCSRSSSPRNEGVKEETPEKPKRPGSWASLVARGGSGHKSSDGKKGRKGSPKGSPGSATHKLSSNNQDSASKAPPQSQPAKEAAAAAASTVTPTPSFQTIQDRRTPEATLFIRNIPDKTQESEIRALFEPLGVATGNKILGITLNPNRGFCFVDFDGSAAVTTIVNEAISSLVKDQRTGRKIESSFMVHGRVLDVERKVQSDRTRSAGGGSVGGNSGGGGGGGRRYNRSHSPKDGGGRYRGSRGGMRRSPPRGGGGGNR